MVECETGFYVKHWNGNIFIVTELKVVLHLSPPPSPNIKDKKQEEGNKPENIAKTDSSDILPVWGDSI